MFELQYTQTTASTCLNIKFLIIVTKEELEETFRAHQKSLDEMKSDNAELARSLATIAASVDELLGNADGSARKEGHHEIRAPIVASSTDIPTTIASTSVASTPITSISPTPVTSATTAAPPSST